MGDIRAFIAIELNSELKSELADSITRLRVKHPKSVKWVNPEGIHLTIKFLGDVPEEKIFDIKNILSKISSTSYPFRLRLGRAGAFPNLRSPRVAWVGMEGDIPELLALQRQVETAMIPLGFTAEKKPFSAHLTLGRVREYASKSEMSILGQDLSTLQIRQDINLDADNFCLMKSTLTPRGAIYEQLIKFTLDKNLNDMIK